jgi:hypothetical protein
MIRRARIALSVGSLSSNPSISQSETGNKTKLQFERGTWNYTEETTKGFQRWCDERQVRSYSNIKVCGSDEFARCTRLTKLVYPGQAIITVPLSACFNFLTVAREMFDRQNTFPIHLSWMDYDLRVDYLPSMARWELAQAGWMCRINSLEDSPATPFIKWILEDTRGRDGVSQGVNKEREEKASILDNILTEMVCDSCEEGEPFLESLFTSIASLNLRSVPIEAEAIDHFLPGTNFFKAKIRDMYVPTLMPLIDAVPQIEGDYYHNCLVEYFPFTGEDSLRTTCRDVLDIPVEMDSNMLEKCGGFFALRAMRRLEPGSCLFNRRFM